MTRFVHWRKMTWALCAWSAGMLTVLLVSVARTPDAAAGCATNSAGATTSQLTRQDCLDAASTAWGRAGFTGAVWLLGFAVLGVLWLTTRPLWQQGRGAGLRRVSAEDFPQLKREPATAVARAPRVRR
jgi:hypothetical protein